ncbi:hypothetical protein [Halostella pelagica]|uniref:hypothetical protein n=1 Tax=Halostella pelagica TaxID=2583824 RepID=UPI001080DB83|nr:hypothetical protein [Halostella pelagica]
MPIPILLKILPTGWLGDVLAVAILTGAVTIVLEALGVPVIDPVMQWVDATLIDPLTNWATDTVTPW